MTLQVTSLHRLVLLKALEDGTVSDANYLFLSFCSVSLVIHVNPLTPLPFVALQVTSLYRLVLLKALEDGTVSDANYLFLSFCSVSLAIHVNHLTPLPFVTLQVTSIYRLVLLKALEDGAVSDAEAKSLASLRTILGLSSTAAATVYEAAAGPLLRTAIESAVGGTLTAVVSWPLQDSVLLRSFCARINHSFIAHSHLHCPHYCNAIARLLRNIRRPPTPHLYAMHNTILVMAISCKGQVVMNSIYYYPFYILSVNWLWNTTCISVLALAI